MGKIIEDIKSNEFFTKEEIEYKEYREKKKELDADEFKNNYGRLMDPDVYYKKVPIEVEEDEVELYIMYELLKEQRKSKKSLDTIKGILIGYALVTIVGLIIIAAQFA